MDNNKNYSILESINNLIYEFRDRVEVIIFNNNKILQTIIPSYKGINTGDYYGFPGGGIEPGDSQIKTVKKETLEEVGVLVTNIKKISGIPPFRYERNDYKWMNNKKRSGYGGTSTHYFTADLVEEGIEPNEGLAYEWVSIDTAKDNLKRKIKEFEDINKIPMFKARLKALEKCRYY